MRISDWSSDVCSSDLPSPQSPRTLALCFADHQICGSRPGLIIKGLRSTYVVRNMHQQVAGIVDQEIADGSPVDCKKQDERQKLRDKAYRLFVDRCRGLDHGNNQPDEQNQNERRACAEDRKGDVEVKRGSVREDHGVRRSIKKK